MQRSAGVAPFILSGVIFCMLAACAGTQSQGVNPGAGSRTSEAILPTPPPKEDPLPLSTGIDQHFTVNVGPPAADIAVWTLEPKAGTPVKGTVLFLHGFFADHRQLENAGEALRKAGYRAVLVDLRGFGKSTGDKITFGVLDAADMRQVTDALQAKKLCGKTLGVYGTSYGAASAILYAAVDSRVQALIAVAPFAAIRDEVPAFGRHTLGAVSQAISDSGMNALANAVSQVTGWDLDDAKPIDAIKQTHAHVLLIHGDADTIIPEKASEELHAADPGSELMLVPGRGHLDLCFDVPGQLQKKTREWFDEYLGGAAGRKEHAGG